MALFSFTRNLAPRLVAPVKAIKSRPLATSVVRLSVDTEVNPKWPRTKEERERAARKYNLIPEDYEPYPEDEAYGDYPKLKAIGAFNRDRYDDFDDTVDLSFYGEPLHMEVDMHFWERMDPLDHEKNWPPIWKQILTWVGALALMPAINWVCDEYDIHLNHSYKKRSALPEGTKFYEYPDKEMDNHILHNVHHH